MGPTSRRHGLVAHVNVTPLADVMIVLLVIFMVATSVLHRPDNLDLPSGRGKDQKDSKAMTLFLRKTGWALDGSAVLSATDLQVRLMRRGLSAGPLRVLADRGLPYSEVAMALAAAREAGAEHLVLMVEERPAEEP